MPTAIFRVGWAVLFVAIALWEVLALRHPGGGDELTAQIRWIVSHPWCWWAGAGLAVWAAGHLFFGWR